MNREQKRALVLAAVALSNCEVNEAVLEGACWLAQDTDGMWYTYATKPIFGGGGVNTAGVWDTAWAEDGVTQGRRIGRGSKPTDANKMLFGI